jgi:hypothetical protein
MVNIPQIVRTNENTCCVKFPKKWTSSNWHTVNISQKVRNKWQQTNDPWSFYKMNCIKVSHNETKFLKMWVNQMKTKGRWSSKKMNFIKGSTTWWTFHKHVRTNENQMIDEMKFRKNELHQSITWWTVLQNMATNVPYEVPKKQTQSNTAFINIPQIAGRNEH